jgi:hypothetical protein
VNLLYVPYRGAAGVLPDLFSSQVQAYFGFMASTSSTSGPRSWPDSRCGPRSSIAECSGHCRDFERNWCPRGHDSSET